MQQYKFNDAQYGTHSLIAQEIEADKTILDVGCNKGYLKQLVGSGVFYGIDLDSEDLQAALLAGYYKVFQLDLNNYRNFTEAIKFDVIVFGDVLEHVVDPVGVLRFFSSLLNIGGKIIVSLPNIAHISIRLALLFGNFNYTESGILDKTHLHFYTKKTAPELLEKAGLDTIKRKYSSNNFGKLIELFPWMGGILGFNLIFVCQKKSS